LGQTLAALTQGQFRKSPQLATCLHLSASIRRKHPFLPSPNLQGCESPLASLIQKEIHFLCEVPGAIVNRHKTVTPNHFI
jgi:hypothetical protein